MKICNRKYLSLFFIIGLAVALVGCGKTETAIKLNTDTGGLALRGFDAVAYFAVDNAVRGDAKYEYIWNGAKWLFASEENMRKFQASPEAYAPQFGGYCSYAVSEGYTADADPEAWKVVDGKLYGSTQVADEGRHVDTVDARVRASLQRAADDLTQERRSPGIG